MLVSAFAGTDTIRAYRTAIKNRYRFFSYGDAMFLTKEPGPDVLSPIPSGWIGKTSDRLRGAANPCVHAGRHLRHGQRHKAGMSPKSAPRSFSATLSPLVKAPALTSRRMATFTTSWGGKGQPDRFRRVSGIQSGCLAEGDRGGVAFKSPRTVTGCFSTPRPPCASSAI